jgi:hypothetical protein
MLTGSLPGEISVFARNADGTLAPARMLADYGGKPLSPGPGTSIALADVDGDGDPDMVVGTIGGPLLLYKNDGKGRFGDPSEIKVEGEALHATDGGPCLADWDGDGILDLLVGHEDGGVRLLRGTRKSELKLGSMEYLVEPIRDTIGFQPFEFKDEARTRPDDVRSANRAKPEALDWDGDGRIDLLVGDFRYGLPPMPQIALDNPDTLERHRGRMLQVRVRMMTLNAAVLRKFCEEHGADGWDALSAGLRARFDREHDDLVLAHPDYDKIVAENFQTSERFYSLRGKPVYTGNLWLYRRR